MKTKPLCLTKTNQDFSGRSDCASSRTISATAQALFNVLVRNIVIDEHTGCWLWTGIQGQRGYGMFVLGGKVYNVHRLFYLILTDTLPNFLCHHCDNKLCCNPDHLFYGNHYLNRLDNKAKGRTGHPDTTYRYVCELPAYCSYPTNLSTEEKLILSRLYND